MKKVAYLQLLLLLVFLLVEVKTADRDRPQEPKYPYSYNSINVKFFNKKLGLQLNGTLTYPKNIRPNVCVVLTHGFGNYSRDEDVLGHKPFLVLSDYLTRNNIAVLRYDESSDLSNTRYSHFVGNAIAGHGKGGLTAIRAAIYSKLVNFIVLLSTCALNGEKILYQDMRQKYSALNESEIESIIETLRRTFYIVKKTQDLKEMKLKLMEETNESEEDFDMWNSYLLEPWFKKFLKMEPVNYLQRIVTQSVLVLHGSKDSICKADDNFTAMKHGLRFSVNSKVLTLDGLNGFLQTSKSGKYDEMQEIDETIAPIALKAISDWIKNEILYL